MTPLEYHARVDALLLQIEDRIDADYPEIDCEHVGGMLSLNFENGTKIIINKQEPLLQIWVATRENGYHFDLKGEVWIDNRFGNALLPLLNQACSAQAGLAVQLD